jgi:hypothetical protein
MINRDELPLYLKEIGLNGIGAEIGVRYGNFSEILVKNGDFKKFYSIDNWDNTMPELFYEDGSNFIVSNNEDIFEQAKKRLENYKNVEIIRKESVEASYLFEDEYFDFIYLDADHTLKGIKGDINAWYPKLKKGGILAGHDYLNGVKLWDEGLYSLFGVKSAVDEFVINNNLNLNIIKEEGNEYHTWYFFK